MEQIPPFFRATELYKPGPSPRDWLVPGIIPREGLVVLASAPKTGKTCFATALARAIVQGREFLGNKLEQGPILWCAHEETPYERSELHEGLDPEDPFYVAYATGLPPLDTPEPKSDRYGRMRMIDMDAPYVFEQAVKVGAKLIVIDCLHAAVQRLNLADNQSARFVMGRLRRWSMSFHIAVLVLHHLTKSSTRGHLPERFADSAQILAAASCHFFLERHYLEEDRSLLLLHGRGRHPAPFARLELESTGPLNYSIPNEKFVPKIKLSVRDRILSALQDGWALTVAQLSRETGAAPTTIRPIIGELLNEYQIEPAAKTERAVKYKIKEDQPEGEEDVRSK